MRYKFEDIAVNISTKRKPTESDMETYVGLEHLDAGSLTVERYGSKVPIKGEKLVMTKGDLLFGRRNTYLKRAAIAPHNGLFSAHGMILRPNEDIICGEFFPFFISSDYFFDEAIKISVGSISPTVNWGTLKELEFELPPISEQKKLAELLWAANDAREAYKKLLTETDELVKARFNDMFTNQVFKKMKLEEICDFITKGTTPHSSEIFRENGEERIPFLKVYNLSSNGELLFWNEPQYIDKAIHNSVLSRSKVYPNDVLMNIVGPPLGKFAIVSDDFAEWNINQAIAIFRSKDMINPLYLLYALMQPSVLQPLLESAVGIRQLNLNLQQCRNLQISLPPLDLQTRFADFVRQADKSKLELKRTLDELEATYKSILNDNLS